MSEEGDGTERDENGNPIGPMTAAEGDEADAMAETE